jgi:hypothetical protein
MMLGSAVPAAGKAPTVLSGTVTEAETVRFADPRWTPVRLLRGVPTNHPAAAPVVMMAAAAPVVRPQFRATATNSEIVTFGDGRGERVTIVRGPGAAPPPVPVPPRPGMLALASLRASLGGAIGLFNPAAGGELDRVAFAVDGVESGHGANLAMWRPELDGPQGPMQVSSAAALDVGGGDRFDLRENRLIGRAYLAAMYRRYGNWPDAIAAYNWGPGNLDQWIAAGRQLDRLPLETTRYLARVLRDAFLAVLR